MSSRSIHSAVVSLVRAFEQGKGRPRHRHFVAVMDDRTCELCRRYHCKVFPYGAGPEPPLHPGCRCYYEPLWQLPSPFGSLVKIIRLL